MKNIQEISKLYKRLQSIDAEIVGIEKLANEILSNECIIKFSMNVENMSEQVEEKRPTGIHESLFSFNLELPTTIKEVNKKSKHDFKITSKAALLALGVIAQSLNETRTNIITQLEQLTVIN